MIVQQGEELDARRLGGKAVVLGVDGQVTAAVPVGEELTGLGERGEQRRHVARGLEVVERAGLAQEKADVDPMREDGLLVAGALLLAIGATSLSVALGTWRPLLAF